MCYICDDLAAALREEGLDPARSGDAPTVGTSVSIGALDRGDISHNALLNALAGPVFANDSTLTYAFARSGELVDKAGYSGGSTFTRAWTDAEKANFRAAAEQFGNVSNLNFVETSSTATSEIDLQMVSSVPGGWAGYAGGSIFVVGDASMELLLHELGHSAALGHSHDTSFRSTILPGVNGAYDAGDFSFNSQIYTVMSYNSGTFDGYSDIVYRREIDALGTLDIAALQALYGANMGYRTGSDTYGLPTGFLSIWDAGGRDRMDFSAATQSATIDLRAATLAVEEGGAGRPSFVGSDPGTNGAYLIAYGAVIEDAIGGSGADRITGNAADNRLFGGNGNDTLRGLDGADWIEGGDGRDRVEMGDGNDRFSDTAQGGIEGRDTVFAGSGNDTIQGGNGDDAFYGQAGNDLIFARLGADQIFGGDGYDTLHGGDGNDRITGGNGRDLSYLGTGNDLFIDNTQGGVNGQDTVFAGNGRDTIQGGNGDDIFRGQAGNDLIFARLGADQVFGGDGMDTLYGGDGYDTLHGGNGDDQVMGGNGRDRAFLGMGNDLYVDNTQNDINGRDTVFGGRGDDTITGGGGHDVFRGEWGNDNITGGRGDDTLVGGSGNDRLTGDDGADVFVFGRDADVNIITDFTLGTDVLQLDDALWAGVLSIAEILARFATAQAGNVLFDFGVGGTQITLEGLNSTTGLADDMIVV